MFVSILNANFETLETKLKRAKNYFKRNSLGRKKRRSKKWVKLLVGTTRMRFRIRISAKILKWFYRSGRNFLLYLGFLSSFDFRRDIAFNSDRIMEMLLWAILSSSFFITEWFSIVLVLMVSCLHLWIFHVFM